VIFAELSTVCDSYEGHYKLGAAVCKLPSLLTVTLFHFHIWLICVNYYYW